MPRISLRVMLYAHDSLRPIIVLWKMPISLAVKLHASVPIATVLGAPASSGLQLLYLSDGRHEINECKVQ